MIDSQMDLLTLEESFVILQLPQFGASCSEVCAAFASFATQILKSMIFQIPTRSPLKPASDLFEFDVCWKFSQMKRPTFVA